MINNNTDIVIIGAGPIGIFTIFEAGMLGMSCHVIESQDSIGGQCQYLYADKPIYDIPAYPEITAKELINKLAQQVKPFNPTYHCGRVACEIDKQQDGKFHVIMDNGKHIKCSAIVIAAGCGAFEPHKPQAEGLEQFEGKCVHYMVKDKNHFLNKKVMIVGGGDSAVDWAIDLINIAKKIYVVHRRKKFRCHPKSEETLYNLSKEGKIEMLIPYQLHSLFGESSTLQQINLQTLSDESTLLSLKADEILILFGLKNDLNHIKNWDLEIENKKIVVDKTHYRTNIPGIYAIGDIATYPGKLKLILTGFAEAATTCHDIYKLLFPNKALNFEYSTNKGISIIGES